MTQISGTFPARPNGVAISYVEVDGGALESPFLADYPAGGEMGNGTLEEPEYSMVVSRFEVRYAVLDCGFGMELLLGSYDNDPEARVKVEQVSLELERG